MYEAIFRNLPGNSAWPGSFYERLVEHAIWDKEQFWTLHLALLCASRASDSRESINRELAWAVATIQSRVLGLVAAHYNQNDTFVITNLNPDELNAYIERFDHAILGVFSAEAVAESAYDLTNPLSGDV
jgi:hypothetical protein